VVPPPRRSAPPAPLNPIIGRDEDLARVEAVLVERRLVLVTGPGGVGKSRMLGELHLRVGAVPGVDADPLPREAAYLDLGHLDDAGPGVLAEALARMLEVRLGAGDPVAGLVAALSDAHLLLFVDEAERSAEAVTTVLDALVRQCPGLRVVVASRSDLPLAGAARHVLAPLPVPRRAAAVAETAASPAVRLLHDRVTDQAPDLVLTDDDVLRLGRMARRVDGLPLALELLAGYAGTRAPAELDAVADEPLALSSDEAGRPERHRSLRDTVLWSASRLPEGHRAVLRRLGVFAGDFDLAAARAVVGEDVVDVDAVVRSLVRDALLQVRRSPDGIEVRMLRTVRDLALAGLAESGEVAATRARHRRWYAARWRGALRSDALLLDVRDHYVDHLEALRSGLDDRDPTVVADLTLALSRLWLFADMLTVGERWMGRALDSGLVTPREAARIRIARASLSFHHEPARARAEVAAVLPVLTTACDHPWLVTGHVIVALERSAGGHHAAAIEAARAAVAAAEQTTRERQADALGVLAVCAVTTEPATALAAVDRAWSLARASGSAASAASVATNLSLALMQLGRVTEARAMLEEAAAELGRGQVPLFVVLNLAWAALLEDDPARALTGFALVLRTGSDGPADRRSAEVYAGAGVALHRLGADAAPVLAGATEIGRRVGLELMPWQRRLVAETGVDGVPPPDGDLGPLLSLRVRELARTVPRPEDLPDWWP
jgi:predicted ATPase